MDKVPTEANEPFTAMQVTHESQPAPNRLTPLQKKNGNK
jgi:hypothetical protein